MSEELKKRLEIKAGMISMGEKISWGSDAEIMLEAATALSAKDAEIAALREALKPFADESIFSGPQHEFVTVKRSDCDKAAAAYGGKE